jgi:hypothetical protein
MAHMVGIFAALGIELLGLLTIRTALRMSKYNQKAEAVGLPKAPATQGYIVASVYVVIVLSLVVFLKIFPSLILWALIPMSLMALVAEWAFLLSVEQSERELEARQAGTEATETEQLREQLTERDHTITELNIAVQSIVANMNAFQATVSEQFTAVHGFMNGLTEQVSALHEQAVNVRAGHDNAGVNEAVQSIMESLNELNERMNSMSVQAVNEQPKSAQRKDEQPKSAQSKPEQNTDKAERQKAVFDYISANLNGEVADRLNKSEIANALNANRVTIGRDIDELIKLGRLSVNGHINVVA